jgi:sugar phosphate isomerase/epimerase
MAFSRGVPVSRRGFLTAGLSATGVLAWRSRTAGGGEPTPAKLPVGVQLYSVRDVAPKDLPGTLAKIKSFGYDGVEFAGYYGKSASELRQLLDANGLKCCGTHTGLDSIRGDALKATAEFHQTLGNGFLIVPGLPRQDKAQGWADLGKQFSEIAVRAKELGMVVGYHAHGGDFAPVEGQVPWVVFFDNASPEVAMQLDTGNCLGGGGDPVAMLKRYPGRSRTIHLKPHGGEAGAPIGKDTVPWTEVLTICETTGGTEWYIVEHESGADSLASIRLCREGLSALGR